MSRLGLTGGPARQPRPATALAFLLLAVPASGAAIDAEVLSGGRSLTLVDVVALTLRHDPNVAIGRTAVRFTEGLLLSARGRFDPVFGASFDRIDDTLFPATLDSLRRETRSYQVGLGTELRSGLVIRPELAVTQTGFDDPLASPTLAGDLVLHLRQPLLRGRGAGSVAADERATGLELAASNLEYEHNLAVRVHAVATQYWLLLASLESYDVQERSELYAADLLDTTQRLVEADQTPTAELVQLEANLASKTASRIRAERVMLSDRQELGREIGLEYADLRDLPLPADGFPAAPPFPEPSAERERFYVSRALEHRHDLAAVRARSEAAGILVRAARIDLQPQADLVGRVGYSALQVGGELTDVLPTDGGLDGPVGAIGLSFSWPTLNRRAEGRLLQNAARQEDLELRAEALVKSIGAEVPRALSEVSRSLQELEHAERATHLFHEAVDNETKKLRAGMSTVIDVITQRDRLTSAQQQEIAARLSLALAILRLRFETGTLLGTAGDPLRLQPGQLTTVPFAGAEGES